MRRLLTVKPPLYGVRYDFENNIRNHQNLDFATIARENHITRARMSQIMSLANLAPDIQQDILFIPRIKTGRDPLIFNTVLSIAREPNWQIQRRHWQHLFPKKSISIQPAGAV